MVKEKSSSWDITWSSNGLFSLKHDNIWVWLETNSVSISTNEVNTVKWCDPNKLDITNPFPKLKKNAFQKRYFFQLISNMAAIVGPVKINHVPSMTGLSQNSRTLENKQRNQSKNNVISINNLQEVINLIYAEKCRTE